MYNILSVFQNAGIDLNQPLVATCGSGVTASILAFAAYILHKDVPVYDVIIMSLFNIEMYCNDLLITGLMDRMGTISSTEHHGNWGQR